MKRFLSAVALALLTACATPTMHQVRLHEPGVQQDRLVRISTTSPFIFLDAVDGKQSGNFRPFFAGPALYAGFDLFVPPGRHTIDVWYGTAGAMYQATTKPVRLDFVGEPGQHLLVSSNVQGQSVQFRIRQAR